MNIKVRVMAVFAITAGLLGARAGAHHSVVAFDKQNPVTLSGTVKEMKWSNPHTWIYVMVPDGQGGEQQWDLEGGAVNMLVRQGWAKDTIKSGMKVKLLIAPRKDGTLGGEWLRLLEIDGKVFKAPVTQQP